MHFLEGIYNLHQYLLNINPRRAVLLAAAAGNALGAAEFFIRPNELVMVPIVVALLDSLSEVESPGDGGKVREGAGVPAAATGAGRSIKVNSIFGGEAVTERADIGADAAAEALLSQSLPDFGTACP